MKRSTCPCGKERRPDQRTCWECHARYMRIWRIGKSPTPIQKLKMNARSYVHVYLKRGKLKRGPCEVCGSLETQSHHDDYAKPLEVRWFCLQHHLNHHGKQLQKEDAVKWNI